MFRKRIIVLVYCIVIVAGNLTAGKYYWVGGTGNWNDLTKWKTTSGGATSHVQVPQSTDTVYFDVNSFNGNTQTVTISTTDAVCHSMDWSSASAVYSGSTNGPSLTISGRNLSIFGSLKLNAGMRAVTLTTGTISFKSLVAGNTIDTKGISINGSNSNASNGLIFDSPTGAWTLSSDLTCSSASAAYIYPRITLTSGSLNTNGKNVICGGFTSTGTTSRTLTMGVSTITLNGNSPAWNVTASLTLSALTGTIIFDANNNTAYNSLNGTGVFIGGALTYGRVYFKNLKTTSGPIIGNYGYIDYAPVITGNNSFKTLILSTNVYVTGNNSISDSLIFSKNRTFVFASGSTQTIGAAGYLVTNGNCTTTLNIRAASSTAATITKTGGWGATTVAYCTFQKMTFSGGGSITANNSTDQSGNTGIIFSAYAPSALYWVGGTGDWHDVNHWSTSSGGASAGCIPNPATDVYFDANSFTAGSQYVIIDTSTAFCKSMNWTGVTNTPSFKTNTTIDETKALYIYGSLTLASAMSITGFKYPIFFNSSNAGNTITSATQVFPYHLYFTGTGEYILQDALAISDPAFSYDYRYIAHRAGTLRTNNQTVTTPIFYSAYGDTRSLYLGSSILNIKVSGGVHSAPFALATLASGLTFDAGTSTINYTLVIAPSHGYIPFAGGNQTFYNVNVSNALGLVNFGGSNIFNDLSITNTLSFQGNQQINNSLTLGPGGQYTLGNYTITLQPAAVLNANGGCSGYVDIRTGTIRKNSGSNISVDKVILKDVTAASTGGVTFTATNVVDLGGNVGWSGMGAASNRTLYWVGGIKRIKTVNNNYWSNTENWSLASGDTSTANYNPCLAPTLNDHVVFNANSFTASNKTVVLDGAYNYCKDMNWTGATNSPVFSNNTGCRLSLYGSLTLISTMTYISGITEFKGTGAHTLTTAGKNINECVFDCYPGSYTCQDDFRSNWLIWFYSGTLNTNGVTCDWFYLYAQTSGIRVLNFGSSTIKSVAIWRIYSPGTITVNAGTSTIKLDLNYAGGSTFWGGDKTYNKVIINNATGNTEIISNNTFNKLSILTTSSITGNNTIRDSLTLGAGKTYTFTAGTTQTFSDTADVVAIGTGGAPIYVQSSASGSFATWSKVSGRVCADYIYIKDSRANGGATFTGGANANDQGGNTGWDFSAYPTVGTGALSGTSYMCPRDSATLSFTLTGSFPKDLVIYNGTSYDTITNVTSSPFLYKVKPSTTTTYTLTDVVVDRCFGGTAAGSGTAIITPIDSTLTAGTWTGSTSNDWMDCRNWLNGILPTNTTDVIIPSAAVTSEPIISSAGAVCRNIEIQSGRTLTINGSGTLEVYGDFDNDGTLTHTAGTVVIRGATNTILSGNSSCNFYNLDINKSASTNTLTFNREINVNNVLTMTNGIVNSTSTNLLTLNSGATTTIGSSSCYVSGPVKAIVATTAPTTINLPLGKNTEYRPAILSVTHSSVASVEYTAEMIPSSAVALGYTMPPTVSHVSGFRYWEISRSSVANLTSATVQLYYSTSGTDDQVTSYTDLTVVKNIGSGTSWVDIGGTATANGTGNILSNSFATFSRFTLANRTAGTNPLPVELINFTANCEEDKVNIKWTTVSETNNDYFTIERTSDGINDKKEFIVDSKAINGNSTNEITYSFFDETPLQGIAYYRLKQTDYDGKFEHFKYITTECNNTNSFFDFSIYPNPNTGEQINLSLTGASDKEVLVVVYDVMGKETYSKVLLSENENSLFALDMQQKLTSGIYFITATSDKKVYKKKMVVQ